jgi:hypothetical protein
MYGPNAASVTYHRLTELRAGLREDVSSPTSEYGISWNLHHTSRINYYFFIIWFTEALDLTDLYLDSRCM